MGKRGRELVLRDHTWKAVVGRFSHALSVIDGERASSPAADAPAEFLKNENAALGSGRRD
jgi:hypothetical protein